MLDTLSGKKTFAVVVVAIGYIAGGHFGYWTTDKDIITALGFAAAAFLRAGIAKAAPDARANNSTTAP